MQRLIISIITIITIVLIVVDYTSASVINKSSLSSLSSLSSSSSLSLSSLSSSSLSSLSSLSSSSLSSLSPIKSSLSSIFPIKTLRNALCFTVINCQLLSSYPNIANAEQQNQKQQQQQQQQYGLKKGRLLVCKQKSNCISSSSITSLDGKYGIPWTYNKDAKDEYNELVNIVKSNKLLKLIDINDDNYYIHAEAKSAVPPTGIDDIEFLLNPIDKIITYRSNSRDLIYAGTDPLPDGGSNKNRLEEIKRALGVKEMSTNVNDEDDEDMKYIKEFDNMNFITKMQVLSQPNAINFEDNSVPEIEDKKIDL